MTENPSPALQPFADAARRVQWRLVWCKGLQALLKTWPYAAALLAGVAALRLSGAWPAAVSTAVVLLLLWGAGCLIFAWSRMPRAYAALSFWDSRTSRSDAFANAWWFERQPSRNAGQQLHLVRQTEKLTAALPALRRDIALPDVRWLLLLPLLALALAFLPDGRGLRVPDPVLTDEARELAGKRGKELAEKKLDTDKMQALSEQERKELEKLQQKVQETAKSLQQGDAKTARSVLSELEKRARDAERLAEKLGAGDAAWASDQMVAEMRKHADTAELGDAVAAKSAEDTGKHAQQIADKLNDPKLTHETRDRFAGTLREIGKQGQPEDKERTVGQHVLNADRDMAQSLPQDASKEFQALADKMRTLAAREKAREQLEKLAQQLRQSGSDIAGQGTQGMQQLAGGQGQQGQGSQSQQSGQPQPMQALQNAPQMQPMPMPGLSNAPQGQQGAGQQLSIMTPVPGSGQQGKPMQLVPGSGSKGGGKNNQPLLLVPVPGTQPGQQPDIAILGMAPGMTQGGLPPGTGSTQMGNTPTEKSKPGQAAAVNAQRNADGASSVRSIEGQAHAESATRTVQATVLEAIAAEESALDDQALPPARREQVRRYFTELRKRFEKEN